MIIEKDGSVSHIVVARKLYDDLDEEALRVIQNSPKWKPAIKDGKSVRMQIVRSVAFKFGPITILPTTYTHLQ
jgi:protein TonB